MVYLAHHYNHEVVTPFTGDSLFLVDQSIPTQKRIDAEVKRVKEMTHASKVAIVPPGTNGKEERGDGKEGGRRKKWI
jgi:hypothetical protein